MDDQNILEDVYLKGFLPSEVLLLMQRGIKNILLVNIKVVHGAIQQSILDAILHYKT